MGHRAGLDGCGNSRPATGIRFPDRPARSQSLYRLSYSVRVCGKAHTIRAVQEHDTLNILHHNTGPRLLMVRIRYILLPLKSVIRPNHYFVRHVVY